MTEEQNLLSGSVPKKLAAFAFPLLLANILQSFYNVVDMLVVGQIVGDTGLAAINNASKLCYIINSICIGMTMGGAVLIAQYKGANDKKGQAETFQTLAILSFVSAACNCYRFDILPAAFSGIKCSGRRISRCLRLHENHLLGNNICLWI